jgi:hypothetical protein
MREVTGAERRSVVHRQILRVSKRLSLAATSPVLYFEDCQGRAQLEHTARSVVKLESAERGGDRSIGGISPYVC